MSTVNLKRYNIYSCLSLRYDDVELCFDPSKILDEDINEISPNAIFISHESMDHLDPIQIYALQKRKNCGIFCSIAAAVDLFQFFPNDLDFKRHIYVLIPGSHIETQRFVIETEKSIHCDYMMPIVFKITDRKTGLSILHCFDSFVSDEIVRLSENTDIAIVPLGIAKGISASVGNDFVNSLHSKVFVSNHVKYNRDLEEFKTLTQNYNGCFYPDWHEECNINLQDVQEKIYEKEYASEIDKLISNFPELKSTVLNDDKLLTQLFSKYLSANEQEKIKLLMLYTIIILTDASVMDEKLVKIIASDLKTSVKDENNCLHAVILFFLGVYSQQSALSTCTDFESSLSSVPIHVVYWFVEYIGRSITTSGKYETYVENFKNIIANAGFYNSVVVRRKIFWELYRVVKRFPSLGTTFLPAFFDGLVDQNPDVRLLAVLCLDVVDKVIELSELQLSKILELLNDEEEDVRENTVKIMRQLRNRDYIRKNKEKMKHLLSDNDCHVRYEAGLTERLLQ